MLKEKILNILANFYEIQEVNFNLNTIKKHVAINPIPDINLNELLNLMNNKKISEKTLRLELDKIIFKIQIAVKNGLVINPRTKLFLKLIDKQIYNIDIEN